MPTLSSFRVVVGVRASGRVRHLARVEPRRWVRGAGTAAGPAMPELLEDHDFQAQQEVVRAAARELWKEHDVVFSRGNSTIRR
ncbi:hypothetical protein ABZX39_06155 [Streptomyces collinus]|uniref:hypothetical protein n=1 Tax=Streptomyces collinus TaxID=42684 RepID=UPI0033A13DB9